MVVDGMMYVVSGLVDLCCCKKSIPSHGRSKAAWRLCEKSEGSYTCHGSVVRGSSVITVALWRCIDVAGTFYHELIFAMRTQQLSET